MSATIASVRMLGWLAVGLLCSVATHAQEMPRLALWITEPIGRDAGAKCDPVARHALVSELPQAVPTLTERDVIAWDVNTGHWTLDPARFGRDDKQPRLHDHCFVLALDGKIISGIVLYSFSARLTRFPTLSVDPLGDALELHLISGNHGGHTLLHRRELDAILARPAPSIDKR